MRPRRRPSRETGASTTTCTGSPTARDDARRLAPAGLPVTFFVGRAGVSRLDRLLTDEDVDRLVPERLQVRAGAGDR